MNLFSAPQIKCPFCDENVSITRINNQQEEAECDRCGKLFHTGQKPLETNLQGIAKVLAKIVSMNEYKRMAANENYHALWAEKNWHRLREIGEGLGDQGGRDLMKKVAYRVRALGGHMHTLDRGWTGTHGWTTDYRFQAIEEMS